MSMSAKSTRCVSGGGGGGRGEEGGVTSDSVLCSGTLVCSTIS